MDDNFFRRRPYTDAGIDAYKILVLAILFIVLVLGMRAVM
jgi:hypothetical protein